MQETLTQQKLNYADFNIKSKNKSGNRSLIIIITFCIIILITFTGFFINIKSNYKMGQKYFLLSLNHARSKHEAERLQETVDEAIKASYIYNINGVYHIVGFIYSNESEANEFLSSVKDYFPLAKIIALQTKIDKSTLREIKSDAIIYDIYKYECGLKNKFYSLCKDSEKSLSMFDVYRELTKVEIRLDENFSSLSSLKKSKLVEKMKVSHSVMLSIIRNCKDEIVIGGDVVENVKLLYMSAFFEDVELVGALNKL